MRLASRLVPPAAIAALAAGALAITAVPAGAQRNDPCANARAAFRAHMDDARFWIGAADRLADGGNQSMADQATGEANYYLGLAGGDLGAMDAAC